MNFMISGSTDIGLTKSTNQDSMTAKVIQTSQGKMAFVVLCDGMGGLDKGEVASASVIRAFDAWSKTQLRALSRAPIEDAEIRKQWDQLVLDQNKKIASYGKSLGIRLGTTVTAMLITQTRYYVMNVGDSRAYEIIHEARQITKDQTFVAREVELGNMTEEEAKLDSRRNVLLQCVGASEDVYPDYFFGTPVQNGVYMLCCDGFRHEITPQEIFNFFCPEQLINKETMNRNADDLIRINKERRERDNITVALVRTY